MKVQVAKIAEKQAKQLIGQEMTKGVLFNPIQIEGVWYVSMRESEFISEFEVVEIEIFSNFEA